MKRVPDKKYIPHAMASLSEGLCPDCGRSVDSTSATFTIGSGGSVTGNGLLCRPCGNEWWAASLTTPGKPGWSMLFDRTSVQYILADQQEPTQGGSCGQEVDSHRASGDRQPAEQREGAGSRQGRPRPAPGGGQAAGRARGREGGFFVSRDKKPGIFDGDPAYERLKALRDSGYDGPVDQDGNPTDRHKEVLDALRRLGAQRT